MKFKVVMGVPFMEEYWKNLCLKADSNKLGKDLKLFKKLIKTLNLLGNNPKHPGLKSHEIKSLTNRYGIKVWQSYLKSKTPFAGRIFWVYGTDEKQITVIGIEPHSENKKKSGYVRVRLSDLN